MGQRTSYAPGTFSWVDLATTDADAAKAFYGRLFGWEGEDTPTPGGATYTLLQRDGDVVGGLYAQGEQQRESGVPPAWTSYVTVEDVDAMAARAAELGGRVVAGPYDVADAGRMAVIADPEGAALALWQPRRRHGADIVNEPGALTWNDLMTQDVEAAARFYRELLGWEVEQIPGAPYWTIRNDGASNGGMMPMPPEQRAAGMPAVWNAYFAVEDLTAAVTTVTDAGGSVMMGPMDVPAGSFAVVRDPQGAVFCLVAGQLDP
jgi:predicted enzyme related to lactoylglutathione lyase